MDRRSTRLRPGGASPISGGSKNLFGALVGELDLHPLGKTNWHQFPHTGGITGVSLLAESHLACHTFPEYGSLCLNIFCCRPRPGADFEALLKQAARRRATYAVRQGRAALPTMSAPAANCPNCGAPVTFRWSSAVQTTCEFCHSILVRTDVDLKKVGEVADLPPDASPIQIGTEGAYQNKSLRRHRPHHLRIRAGRLERMAHRL